MMRLLKSSAKCTVLSKNFKKAHTGSYNDKLKRALQNAIDRLPEESPDNIEYVLFTTAPVNIEGAMKKIANTEHEFSTDAVVIFVSDDIDKFKRSKMKK